MTGRKEKDTRDYR